MTDREPGFYWVMLGSFLEVAEWTGEQWLATGDDDPWPESEIDQIGPKIEPPNETGYIIVPTDPVPEVYAARIEPPDARPRRD